MNACEMEVMGEMAKAGIVGILLMLWAVLMILIYNITDWCELELIK